MTKEQIVGLAVRLFAIFLFVYGIRSVPSIVRLSDFYVFPIQAWLFIGIYILIFISFSILLWFFPITVARKLLPLEDKKVEEKPATASDVELVAYSILGLWVLSRAVPDMFYWIVAISARPPEFHTFTISHKWYAAIVSTIIELVIGFWFLFGAKGLRGLIRKLRYAGS